MTIPSFMHPDIEKAADKLMDGRSRTSHILADICVSCGKDAHEFRNEISRKEFSISGLCQECQDGVFGKD